MSKKTIIILIIVALVLIIIGYWYYRNQIFSKGILKLEILGPDSAQVGEEITYTVRYKNNSNFTLEKPKLIFEYPEYSISQDEKDRTTKTLDDIYPGDEQFVQFKARLFGKENDLKVAKAYLSYKPKNLSAQYESDTTLTTKINPVPLTLDFDLPSKLETGKTIQFSLNYFSNIDYPLSGLKLTVEYPEKFEFSDSDPKTLEKTEWEISSLKKAQGGRIKITGKIIASSGEKVTFGAKLGIWQDGDFILLKETTAEVETIEPLLYISQQINGSADYVASPGENLHYEIYFKNIGSSPFENLYLINKLDGSAFDLSTIKTTLGQARVNDNLIIWDWKQISSLRSLNSQEEGKVEFDIKLKNEWTADTAPNNTTIQNEVDISDISQEFQTKVNSNLIVLQTGTKNDTTTYTITWQVKNHYNDVKNVKVRAVLPAGVSLTGDISPGTEISKFSFDSTSREIVWTVGDLAAGAGVSNTNAPGVSFQVTTSQTGQFMLVNKPKITGEDQWTGQTIQWEGQAIDTTLSNNQSTPPNEEE